MIFMMHSVSSQNGFRGKFCCIVCFRISIFNTSVGTLPLPKGRAEEKWIVLSSFVFWLTAFRIHFSGTQFEDASSARL